MSHLNKVRDETESTKGSIEVDAMARAILLGLRGNGTSLADCLKVMNQAITIIEADPDLKKKGVKMEQVSVSAEELMQRNLSAHLKQFQDLNLLENMKQKMETPPEDGAIVHPGIPDLGIPPLRWKKDDLKPA